MTSRHVPNLERVTADVTAAGATRDDPPRLPAVQAYLLGTLDFETSEFLLRRLTYEVAGDPTVAAVVLCDHPTGITVGRDGSRAHLRLSEQQLAARRWPVRWVARGGGVLLHTRGQVACYPVLPLQPLGLTPGCYVRALGEVAAELARGLGITVRFDEDTAAVRVRGRRMADVGVAVRSGVTSFGLVVNVNPDLAPFRDVDCGGDQLPMTSLQRECPNPVRVPTVRQRLLELLADRFGFDRLSVFHNHPSFLSKPPCHAIPARRR